MNVCLKEKVLMWFLQVMMGKPVLLKVEIRYEYFESYSNWHLK